MARVLFADSEPHIQRLFQEELEDEGYEVAVAGDAGEVVRLMDIFHPDVVILEVLLPGMSGLETARIIKGTRRSTMVILFSNFVPPRNLPALGADAYVRKSSDINGLKETVRRLLLA